jgi:phage terminase Nu1 subunit (DNA packaging protein)
MTKRALAKQHHVTVNTITAWLIKGCPHTRGKDGRYRFDRQQVARWRAENLSIRPVPAPGAKSYIDGRGRK